MKIYSVEFDSMWSSIPCGLIIAAEDLEQAQKVADTTITHTKNFTVREADTSVLPCVVFYESGDY